MVKVGSCLAGCGRSAAGGKPMCLWCCRYVGPHARDRLARAIGGPREDAALDWVLKSYRFGKRQPAKRGIAGRTKQRKGVPVDLSGKVDLPSET